MQVVDPLLVITQKIISSDVTHAASQEPVVVGVDFDSIQSAIAANRLHVVIAQDTVITEDVSMPSSGTLWIEISPFVTLTMQDAIFKKEKNSGSAHIKLSALAGLTVPKAADSRPTFLMSYTSAPYNPPFVVDTVEMSDVLLVLSSPAVTDLLYAYARLILTNTRVLFNCAGMGQAALVPRFQSRLTGCEFSNDSVSDFWMFASSGTTTFAGCDFLATQSSTSAVVFGEAGTSENITIQTCTFSDSMVVGSIDNCALWENCTFSSSVFSSTPTGSALASDCNRFTQCIFRSPSADMDVSGAYNVFDSCFFDLGGADLVLSGSANSVLNSRIKSAAAGLLVEGDNNTVFGCTEFGSDFALSVAVGATNNKIIGNSTSAVITDLGTTTYIVGNSF